MGLTFIPGAGNKMLTYYKVDVVVYLSSGSIIFKLILFHCFFKKYVFVSVICSLPRVKMDSNINLLNK